MAGKPKNLPALGGSWRDTASALVKGAIGAVPVVGSILGEVVGLIIPNQRLERIEAYLALLGERLQAHDPDGLREHFEDPETVDLFEEGAVQSLRALSDERKAYIATIVANGISGEAKDRIEAKRLLKLLAEIDDDQVVILTSYLHRHHRDDEFRERYKAVLAALFTFLAMQAPAFSQGTGFRTDNPHGRALLERFGERPIGYGANTYGGEGGEPCLVVTANDAGPGTLRECLEAEGPRIVTFASGLASVALASSILVQSDKTLDGRGSPLVTNAPGPHRGFHFLRLRAVRNVIIADMAFRRATSADSPCAAPQMPLDTVGCGVIVEIGNAFQSRDLATGTRDVWLHRNVFSTCGDKCVTGWNGVDRVTISANRFSDTYYGVLFGNASGLNLSVSTVPEMRVSFYRNHFQNIRRRSPRCASFVKCHVFSNVIGPWGVEAGDFGSSSSAEAEIVLERNFYWPQPGTRGSALSVTDNNGAGDAATCPDANGCGRGLGRAKAKENRLVDASDRIGPLELRPADLPRFDPELDYAYSLWGTDRATRDQIVREAGPRPSTP